MPHNRAFDRPKFKRASRRQLRRAQLWHASRSAVPSYAEWKASWSQIADAVEAILEREFGAS